LHDLKGTSKRLILSLIIKKVFAYRGKRIHDHPILQRHNPMHNISSGIIAIASAQYPLPVSDSHLKRPLDDIPDLLVIRMTVRLANPALGNRNSTSISDPLWASTFRSTCSLSRCP
jgi:hypothetical protein